MAPQARIRPLFIWPYSTVGGAELFLLKIVDAMGEPFEPRGLVMQEGPLAEMLQERGVPTEVKHLPGRGSVRHFREAARDSARELRGKVSLVHANGIKAAIFGAVLSRHLEVPVVWMKHDHVMDGLPTRIVGRQMDAVICVSEVMASQFPSSVRPRVFVVYPSATPPPRAEPIGSRLEIAAVGRLDPAKGFDNLLRATKLLHERGIYATITIAGPVDRIHTGHDKELVRLARDLGLEAHASVGWQDDLEAVYTRCRLVALASRQRRSGHPGEGAPTVLLEGMAHARPVVAPREGGIAEIVGDAGTLLDDRSPAALATGMEVYLRDRELASSVGSRGRARVLESFTIDHALERLQQVYESVLR